jgi:hypothetical protein
MLTWFPDEAETTPEVLVEVEALPTSRGYGGAPSQVSAGYAALAAACNGAALLHELDGSTRLIAGTQTRLYEGSAGSWTDRSRAGNYTTGDAKWRFAQFGATSLAVSKVIQLQSSATGAFADVANSPKAALMESVGAFILLANCDDTGTGLATGFGDQPNRWWCSPIFSPTTTWAPSVSTQCASGLLVSAPGPITGLKRLGDTCIAYKARAMYVGQATGSAEVWRWDLVPGEIGCANNEAIVSIGSSHLFVGYEDIYAFDGSRPVSIGAGIKEWFFADLNKLYAYKIEGIHDYINTCVWWFYPSGESTTLDAALIYNYKTQRWGRITIAVECPVLAVQSQVTYDGLGALFATYDDLPSISYDSPFWQGGAPVLSVFNTSHVLKTLTGTSGASYIVTGWFGDDDAVSTVTKVRPRYETKPATATITPRSVMALGDSPTVGAVSSINGNRFDVLQSARFHAFRLDFTGDFEIQAVLPQMVEAGFE